MSELSIPLLQFNKAKTGLSSVMTEVVHGHTPQLVVRNNKEHMLLIESGDLAEVLKDYRFNPTVIFDEGEVTVELRDLGVLGFGETLDEALEDAASELRAYAYRFFERHNFYSETDRASHAPWLLRFAVTPPDQQVNLLRDDARAVASETAKEGALAPA